MTKRIVLLVLPSNEQTYCIYCKFKHLGRASMYFVAVAFGLGSTLS
jgi:hypothetical protein